VVRRRRNGELADPDEAKRIEVGRQVSQN